MIKSGSFAMKDFPNFRKIQDRDYICTQAEYDFMLSSFDGEAWYKPKETKWGWAFKPIANVYPLEFEIVEKHESSRLLYEMFKDKGKISPEAYLMLKLSHRFLKNSPHFLKTMRDIQFLRKNGIEVSPELKEIQKIRSKETYDYAHPKLNRNKNDFFENIQEGYKQQDYLVYDHDSIHESVKLLDKPAYDYIKISSEDVLCSKEQFDKQPDYVKLLTVYEETAVLALERILIPNNFTSSPQVAFLKALEKVCTSISSGWWREYAWENYDAVIALWKSLGEIKYVNDFQKVKNTLPLWSDRLVA